MDKPYELKEEIGSVEYYLLFIKVFDYFKKLEDENTIVLSYGDDNILMYLKNRDMEYVRDLTDGVLISVHDELNIKEPMYITASIKEKTLKDDMENIIKKADERK